jgi:N-acyl-D-amino-acid deacylase
MANEYDLVIRNGTMIDGTGAQPREADVAVRDGRMLQSARSRAPAPRRSTPKAAS